MDRMRQYTLDEFSGIDSYDCPDCDRTFDTERGKNVHWSKVHDENGGRVEKTCPVCGDEFEAKRSNKDEVYRCSRECRDKGGNAGYSNVVRECSHCGDEVRVPKNRAERTERSFCDKSCEGKWRSETQRAENHPNWVERVELECEWCESTFKVLPHKSHKRCCSRECAFSLMSKEKAEESGEPRITQYLRNFYGEMTWRNITHIERGDKCQQCGKEPEDKLLDVHHIVPIRFGGTNARWNLITVCRSCHRRYDNTTRKVFADMPDLSKVP